MRVDGRRTTELRQVTITPNFVIYPEGSVLIAMGMTVVLCNATINDGVPRWMQTQDKPGGWITGEYALLPRSTHSRTPRETKGLGGRTQEIRRLIGRSLRAAVDLKKLGRRTVIVDCDVLQADGGTRTAAITGGYIAMAIALRKLVQANTIPPETMKSGVAAVSVGVINREAMLDLCYEEDSAAEVDFNIVMNGQGEFIEVQGSAEGKPFSKSMLEDLLNLASQGIDELLCIQKDTLEKI